jgi:hypothetical protein
MKYLHDKMFIFKDISTVMEAQMKTSGALPQVEIDSLDIQGAVNSLIQKAFYEL